MKVLHCLNHFLPQHIAGTEVYVMALMNGLNALGIHSSVVIPNYGKSENDTYDIEGFRVWQYAEPSVIDRALQMGKRKPDGLKKFEQVLLESGAAIIHFHELAGSNGLGLEHVKLAKRMGFKTIMTFHVAGYTCKTGTLMYQQAMPCDGLILEKKCTACWYQQKGITGLKASLLGLGSSLFYKMNADISVVASPLATALSFPMIIQKLRNDFESLLLHTDALVAISHWYLETLKKNTNEHAKLHLIEQALPGKILQEHITDIKHQGILKLVFIGRISHFKGIKDLLTAIKLLPQQSVSLDIYGDTSEQEYMEECKSMSASMSNVYWKGRLAKEEVVKTLLGYDVLCLPSVVCEMAPLVIQEAFAAGIPVLASNVYGNAEQIKEGLNGWLFKFKDVNDLYSKIKILIDSPGLIEDAKKGIPALRSFDTVANEYYELYRHLK